MKRAQDANRDVAFLVALTLLLIAATWQRSGDPFIDWGPELYGAMSVARGLGIPEDVQLLFGSLSPLVNGAILHLAGEHLAAILLANLTILVTTSALIWWIAARVFGRLSAFMATLVWLLLAGFPHLVRVGNYNFLTPYSHGITLGLSLGLLCVVCILQALRRPAIGWWFGAGSASGLALFAKPEAGFAALATLITGILLEQVTGPRRTGRAVVAALGGLGVASVIIISVARLAGGVPYGAHLGPYRSAARALRMDLPFYGGGPFGRSLAATFVTGATLFLTIIAVVWFAERRDVRFEASDDSRLTGRWRAASVALPVLAVTACAAVAPFAWHRLAATLPWMCAVALISSVHSVSASARAADDEQRSSAGGTAILAVFATGWLLKIGLTPRFDHYGFALAAPALLLGIGLLTGDRGLGSGQHHHSPLRRRAVGSALALFLALSAASQSAAFYLKRTVVVGASANRMFLFESAFDPRTDHFRELLRDLEASPDFHAGAIILPEGGLFHFLLREPSTIRIASLMPLEVLMLGSGHVVELISSSAPALIVVADPGLQEWSRPGSSALQPFTELMGAVESNCVLSRETGERTTGADRMHVRYFSPCPGFGSGLFPDSSNADPNPRVEPRDP